MDEKDKKIQELTDNVTTLTGQIKTLTGQLTTVTGERDTFKTEAETLKTTVADKEAKIIQQGKDLVLQRGQFKKMADRSKEELEAMTDSEKEALQRAEDNANELGKMRTETAERNKREFEARRDALISKYAGKNPDVVKKVLENLGKLNPELLGKAVTDADLQPLVEMAYNALGIAKPNAIGVVVNAGGGEAAGGEKKDFADTPEGQELLKVLDPAAVETKK